MVNILIVNNEDILLENCVRSLQQQTVPVKIFVANLEASKLNQKLSKEVIGISNINTLEEALSFLVRDVRNHSSDEQYYGIVLSSQVMVKNKIETLQNLLRADTNYSYAYSDFETKSGKVFEHPFDLRVIGTGRYPNPFGLFNHTYLSTIKITPNLTDTYNALVQKSLFAHYPSTLFIDNSNAPNR